MEKRIKSEIDTNSELKCQFHEIEAQLHGEKIKRENIESEMKNVHEIRKMFNFILKLYSEFIRVPEFLRVVRDAYNRSYNRPYEIPEKSLNPAFNIGKQDHNRRFKLFFEFSLGKGFAHTSNHLYLPSPGWPVF